MDEPHSFWKDLWLITRDSVILAAILFGLGYGLVKIFEWTDTAPPLWP